MSGNVMSRPSASKPSGMTLGFGMGVALMLAASSDDASAAALGGFAASAGLFAALTALLLMKGWQAHLAIGALGAVGGMLALVVGAGLVAHARASTVAGRLTVMRPARGGMARGDADRAEPISLPPGIHHGALIAELREHFVRLQAVWDIGSREALAELTTPEMLEELCVALPVGSAGPNHTVVVTLEAALLAFEQLGAAQVACVEFSGMIRESVDQGAVPFRELWMLTRPAGEGSGWRLARHQALL